MPFFEFMDMHSGGRRKSNYNKIYIEAQNERHAIRVFVNQFNRDPHHVTCSCCGSDYSIAEGNTLEELTEYDRSARPGYSILSQTLEEYVKQQDIIVIPSGGK